MGLDLLTEPDTTLDPFDLDLRLDLPEQSPNACLTGKNATLSCPSVYVNTCLVSCTKPKPNTINPCYC